MATSYTTKRVAPLKLTFESTLATRMEATLRRFYATPVWVYGGRRMTTVRALTRVLALGEERDYFKIVDTLRMMGETVGFETTGHIAPSDGGPIEIPKGSTWETPLIYLDAVERVVVEALPRKGPKKLAVFTEFVAEAAKESKEAEKERLRIEKAIKKSEEKLKALKQEYKLLLVA